MSAHNHGHRIVLDPLNRFRYECRDCDMVFHGKKQKSHHEATTSADANFLLALHRDPGRIASYMFGNHGELRDDRNKVLLKLTSEELRLDGSAKLRAMREKIAAQFCVVCEEQLVETSNVCEGCLAAMNSTLDEIERLE